MNNYLKIPYGFAYKDNQKEMILFNMLNRIIKRGHRRSACGYGFAKKYGFSTRQVKLIVSSIDHSLFCPDGIEGDYYRMIKKISINNCVNILKKLLEEIDTLYKNLLEKGIKEKDIIYVKSIWKRTRDMLIHMTDHSPEYAIKLNKSELAIDTAREIRNKGEKEIGE